MGSLNSIIQVWFLVCGWTEPVIAQLIYKSPSTQYLSRPDITAPEFNISISDPERIDSGYWFLTVADPWVQPGPYIYDNKGDLVWSGFDESSGRLTTDLKVVEYLGQTCISFFRGNRQDMHAVGNGIIMDNNYNIQSVIGSQFAGIVLDEHEFNVLDNGRTALITSYRPRRYDLSEFGITTGVGWLLDSLFYELDLQTNKIIYSWSAMDHIDPSESQFFLIEVPGTGFTQETAWDYFHINSVEKTKDGDYLVSSRHTSSVYKISKETGTVLWRLGGPKSSFEMDPALNFSYQHHARIMTENRTTTIISFLDNACGSWPNTLRSSPYSRGLVVALENSTSRMMARVLRKFDNPDRRSAIAKGSMQTLANRNLLIGWGQAGALSEITPDGKLALHAKFSSPGAASYRAYKYNFTAIPRDPPDIWTYSLGLASPIIFYVSWNGATEVHSWNFYACNMTVPRDVVYVGSELKRGFETIHTYSQNLEWAFAEAVSADGKSLGNSTCVSTFVPSSKLRVNCRTEECSPPDMDTIPDKHGQVLSLSYIQNPGVPPYLGKATNYGGELLAFCLGIIITTIWRLGIGSTLYKLWLRPRGFQHVVSEID